MQFLFLLRGFNDGLWEPCRLSLDRKQKRLRSLSIESVFRVDNIGDVLLNFETAFSCWLFGAAFLA